MAPSDTDPLTDVDTDVEADDLVGTHTYDVLYTPDRAAEEIPVDVRTGEPVQEPASVETAKAFAARAGENSDAPYIAKPADQRTMIETQSGPYTASVFCHFSHVGGMDWHRAFLAAYRSEAFAVDVDADYEMGQLTIEVERRQ